MHTCCLIEIWAVDTVMQLSVRRADLTSVCAVKKKKKKEELNTATGVCVTGPWAHDGLNTFYLLHQKEKIWCQKQMPQSNNN